MQSIPDILYKYYPANRIGYLENELVRFTQPSELNDPFECLPAINQHFLNYITKKARQIDSAPYWLNHTYGVAVFGKEVAKRIPDYENLPPSQKKELLETAKENRRLAFSKFGIFSLSATWKNPLMWAHYTDNHQGVCIGFNSNHEFFQKSGSSFSDVYTIPVSYTSQRPSIVNSENNQLKNDSWVKFKSKDWGYEEEFRILRHLSDPDEKKEPNIYLYRLPHSSIKEIILGYKSSSDLKNRVKAFCRDNRLKLYLSQPHEKKYEMSRHQIKSARA